VPYHRYIPLDGQRPAPLTKRVAAPKSELKRTHTGHVAAPLSTPGVGGHHEHVSAPLTVGARTGAAAHGGGGIDILGGLSSFEFTEAPAPVHSEPGAPATGQSSSYVQPPLTAIHTPTANPSSTYTQPPLTAIHKPGVTSSPAAAAPAPVAAAPNMPPGFAAALKSRTPPRLVPLFDEC
jgi:hypothetical protein